MDLPRAVREAADVSAVNQLVLKERESRDLWRWDDLRDCYHPDGIVHVSWFRGSAADFVKGSIDMASRLVNRHRLSPVHAVVTGNRAVATLSAIVEIPTRLQDIEMTLMIYSRFVYRAERRDESWRLFSFDAIYLRDDLLPAIPGHTITIDPRELQAFRPSYRLLAYVLSKKGYTIGSDLPGEDKPETVRALMDEVSGWAGVKSD